MIDDSLQKGTVPELDALVPSVATETPWAKGGEDNEEAVRNSRSVDDGMTRIFCLSER